MSFFEWQARFDTEEACKDSLYTEKWPNGFQCPHCGHTHAHFLPSRGLYQCSSCHKQHSVTAETVFHSAKLRKTMGHRDSLYRLTGHIELDDAFVGGEQKGKRGRGATGKKPIIVACESQGNRTGTIAIEAVGRINHDTVDQFSKRKIMPEQSVYTDAFRGLTSFANTQEHLSRVTPAEKVDEWVPWVHTVISNLKRFLLGTFHGVKGKYLQEYINEFCYRFNQRHGESEIPARLLVACTTHLSVKSC